jgi:hypothetical protein
MDRRGEEEVSKSSGTLVKGPSETDLVYYENIDRLLNVEARIKKTPVGVVPRLYSLVRRERPISYEIASALLERPSARIGFVTGIFLPPHFPLGEIDGPIGGLVFARALTALGYSVSLIMERQINEAAARLVPIVGAEKVEFVDGNVLDARGVRALTERLDVVITSERLGVNAKGVRHTINGTKAELVNPYSWPDELVKSMNAAGKLTIGIGDGGNEIGFGAVFEQAREFVPNGKSCRCPCADGIITSTATKLLFPVNVSNFGAYGIIAAMGLALGRQDILHTPEMERSVLPAALGAGFVDGGTGLAEQSQDGIPLSGSVAFVAVIEAIVSNALRDFVRPF